MVCETVSAMAALLGYAPSGAKAKDIHAARRRPSRAENDARALLSDEQ